PWLRAGPWLSPAPRTSAARREAAHFALPLQTRERLCERDRQVVAKVVAAVRPLATGAPSEAAAEERVEDVGKRHIGKVDRRSARAHRGVAEHVIAPSPIGI